MTLAHAAVALMLALLLAACGDNPMGPSPMISCPAAQSVQSPSGNAVTVNYPMATAMGGTAPVTTTCAPPSGSTFALGSTIVTCTAQDAAQRAASCTFAVSVARPPQLTATRFLAFGDSITSGKMSGDCPFGGGASSCRINSLRPRSIDGLTDLLNLSPRLGEESSAAYPRVLQAMLASRYATQSIVIPNLGNSGEFVADGKIRLTAALNADPPQVLLLQEGANDMTPGNPPVNAIVNDFRSMVRDARSRGVQVFIGTLLPQREGACRGYDFCDGVNHIVPTNAGIRTMAAEEGAILVDLHQGFDGQTGTLLGLDGLHPNEAGYQKMAEMFFEAIRQRLEVR